MRKGVDCRGNRWEEKELSALMSDLRNQKFGMLIPLFPVVRIGKNRGVWWLCQCDCGNFIVRGAHALKYHATESCGCLSAKRKSCSNDKQRLDMIGRKFNKLTVVDVADIKLDGGSKRTYYKCMCDCGNPDPVIVRGNDLKLNKQVSCGCAISDAEARKREDLTGIKFGKLLVIGFAFIKNQKAYWRCKCECGNEADVSSDALKGGKTSSCGCIKSVGERNIMNILNYCNISYLHNKGHFTDLVGENGHILRYDFIILDKDIPIRLVEFDGLQHEESCDYFGGEEALRKIQINDLIKNQYALSHNIPLVRIPYSKRDTVTYDDIFGDKYLIKGDI